VRRQTIQTPITVSGKGLHTGTASSVCLRPKLDNAAGWTINQIPLQECHILSSRLATKIGVADHTVSTTEHLFAALVGLGITDIHIETTDHEIPILDGSSKLWFDRLTPISLDSEVKPLRITQKLNINNGTVQLSMTPSDTYSAKITVDFDGYAQEYFEGDMRHFKEAMGARTFG
jgi:UDP-3-O-acyl-N-acetylglucosamine deacetylase